MKRTHLGQHLKVYLLCLACLVCKCSQVFMLFMDWREQALTCTKSVWRIHCMVLTTQLRKCRWVLGCLLPMVCMFDIFVKSKGCDRGDQEENRKEKVQ